VRVRIIASAVTASDIFIRSAHVSAKLQVAFRLMMGLTKPRHPILGFVFSGVVDQAGAQTSRFTPGDACMAAPASGSVPTPSTGA
jgi:NADPH:quinone reductase-like Zn-dependent oxidoreductase